LFVCGPHAAGKTSVLTALHTARVLTFVGPEIGKQLFSERRLDTAAQPAEFEIEVTRNELARDRRLADMNGVIAVETWHPGNLAYAAVRNPACVPVVSRIARRSPLLARAGGVWLRIPPVRVAERTPLFGDRAKWAADFYARVDANIGSALESLGLMGRTVRIDAQAPLDEVVARVKAAIESWAQPRRSDTTRVRAGGEPRCAGAALRWNRKQVAAR
jgi:hypothetical protein